ncbi:MAG: TIGR01777 family oxidoreductase [Myxococcales bacterium]
MRFLITGATGFLGRHLWTALRGLGHEGIILARDPEKATKVLPGARIIEWNGVIGLPPEAAFDGVDVVVNLIGESVARRWNDERKRRFRDTRVLPTRALVERMFSLTTRPRCLISIAGTAFYGDRGDEVLTETSNGGSGFLAKLSQEWEAAATAAESLGVRTVVLRLGAVLGRDGGILPSIVTPFRFGVGGKLGNGRQYFPWIHLSDAIGLLIHLAEAPSASRSDAASDVNLVKGPVNGVAPEPVTNAEFTAALGRALGRPVALGVPAFALKLALGEMAQELLLASQRVSPVRALAAGYIFKFPLLQPALADLLRAPPAPPGANVASTVDADRTS